MSKKNRRSQRHLSQIVLAGMLSGLGVYAYAAPPGQFVLQNNQLTISAGSGTTFTTQAKTISAGGVVEKFNDVPSTNGVGIPSFSFTILENDEVPDGTYDFSVGVVIDDQNSARQMEAIVGTLTLVVNGNNITGTIPAQDLEIRGRNGAGSLSVTATVNNAGANGPVNINGGTVTFDAAELITRLRNKFNSITDIILDEFDDPATYDYSIVAKQLSGPAIAFGTATIPSPGTFTAFPTIATASTEFELGSPSTGSLNGGYIVVGEFNVVYVAPDDGSTPGDELEEDAEELDDALDNIVIPATGPISAEVITQVNDAITDAGELADNTATGLAAGTVTVDSALTLLTTVNRSLTLAGTATQAGGTVNTTAAVKTINSVADVMAAVAGKTLTPAQVTAVVDLAINTLAGATNLIGADATTDSVVAIVNASTSILQQASAIAGTVSLEIAEQIRQLGEQAISALLPNLPDSITQGVDLGDTEAVQELLRSVPGALQQALKGAATLTAEGTVTTENGAFTPGDLISLILSGEDSLESSDVSTTTDELSGNFTIGTPTERYVTASPIYRLVPESIPEGVSFLPNGTAVLVGNGIATELAPTAFDSVGFDDFVTDAGLALTYRDNGTVNIDLGSSQRFSGAFAFDNLISATSCGEIGVSAPAGNPTAPGYAFTLTCANGPVQHITPIADNELFYTTIVNAGLNVSTDRNTGVVIIENVGTFKPSFFVTPLTVSDQAYLNTNQNADGVVFRASDVNGDGKMDYEFIASSGVQVFYGL